MVIYWGAYLKKVHPDFLNVSGILSDLMGLVVAFIPEVGHQSITKRCS